MKRIKFLNNTIVCVFSAVFFLWMFSESDSTVVLAQEPTAASSTGIFITVVTDEPEINVRMGPSSSIYPIVGTLVTGSIVPALGRSQGGDWIQIEFPDAPFGKGWVYSPLVQVSGGILLEVEPPPTPVPPATSTIDPTLAAQFVIVPTTTRLPTFTPPPSLTVPTYTVQTTSDSENSVPLGIIIAAFGTLGLIGFSLSLFMRR